MMGKIEISEEKKNRIIDRAGHLADEVGARLLACCPATFVAICEAFREEGIELFPPETQEMITQGMIGLHGGMGMTGVGTCGAVTASMFIISYVVGVSTEELAKDGNLNYACSLPGVESVVDRFEEDYGAIDCLRVRYNRVQRALDLTDPDARILELTFSMLEPEKCGMPAGKFENGRDQTPPVRGARYACETICELLAMEPAERKILPFHVRGLGPQEMAPKLEKVVQALKELDWGRPDEKISYREYRKLRLKGKKGLEKERLGSVSAPRSE
jgi:hypothetical protein